MIRQARQHEGFSTVELLISLFIAAAFIATAFQLYFVVTEDSNETRLRSRAGSIATETLNRHKDLAPIPCQDDADPQEITIPSSSLPAASGEVSYSCPYGSVRTTRINVTIQYGNEPSVVKVNLDVSR